MMLLISSLRVVVIALAAIFFFGQAQAQDVTCRKGDILRRVQVVIENARRGLPCEVVLWSTPTEQQRLWRAEFERGFCADKLRIFVEQLTDNRWLCRPTDPPRFKRQPPGLQPVM